MLISGAVSSNNLISEQPKCSFSSCLLASLIGRQPSAECSRGQRARSRETFGMHTLGARSRRLALLRNRSRRATASSFASSMFSWEKQQGPSLRSVTTDRKDRENSHNCKESDTQS